VVLLAAGCTGAPPPVPPAPGALEVIAGTGVPTYDGEGVEASSSSLNAPIEITFSAAGLPWILDWNNQRVREIDPAGRLITVVGTGAEGGTEINVPATEFGLLHALHVRAAGGELWIAGNHDPRVLKVDGAGRVRAVAGVGAYGYAGDGGPAGLARMQEPSGIAVAPDGTAFVADLQSHTVRKITPDGIITRYAGNTTPGYSGDGGAATDAQLLGPTRLLLGPDGELWIADNGNHAIRKVDRQGRITTVAGNGIRGAGGDGGPAAEAQLSSPMDLELLSDGSLLIADNANHRLRRVDPGGIISTAVVSATVAVEGPPPLLRQALRFPWGIAVDTEGRLWIASTGDHRVYRSSTPLLEGVTAR
jgi:sugar lactone lactonase YvrE